MTKKICLRRNGVVSKDRDYARIRLDDELTSAADGEIMINRYMDDDENAIKVLIGFHTDYNKPGVINPIKNFVLDPDAMPKDAQSYIDGKISSLKKDDKAVAKKFVTSVSEAEGIITVNRGEITSKDKTIKMTDGPDGGLDVAANIDGTTIIKNESSGVLSVASGALTQYKGTDAIKVSEVGTDNSKTVGLSINSIDKVLTQNNDGLLANINLTWDKKEGLKLIGKDSTAIATIPATDFIKDGMLENATYDETTHKITLTFNTDSGKQDVELNLSDLVDTYEAGNGLELTGNVFSVKKSTDTDSEKFLTVGTNGIKVSGIKGAIETAVRKARLQIIGKNCVNVSRKTDEDGNNLCFIEVLLASDSNLINDVEGLRLADKIDCGEY